MPEILELVVGASSGYEENHKCGIVCIAQEVCKVCPILFNDLKTCKI